MSEVISNQQHYLSEFDRVKSDLPGNNCDWLNQLRRSAIDFFSHTGFPTRKDEDWKYTSVNPIIKHPFQSHKPLSKLNKNDLEKYQIINIDAYKIVFIDGRYSEALSDSLNDVPGLSFLNMNFLLEKNPDTIKKNLVDYADNHMHDAFSALNTAFINDGVYLQIDKHSKLEKPIQILYINHRSEIVNNIRNEIVAREGSDATIIETYVGAPNTYLTNSITNIETGNNAQIKHYKVQCESPQSFHVGTVQVQQNRDSQFTSHSFSFGGRLVRSDTYVDFNGGNASATLNGLYIGRGEQHIDHHTAIQHHVPHCTSRELYKGILDDKARAVFNGKVLVAEQAQKTDTDQKNQNILLSKQAEVNTKPQLEIFADDVKCTHGATVGSLDEKAFFYLRSRGIDEDEARRLLIHAFTTEVFDRVEHEALRAKLKDMISF